jgi:hypothetical protein
MKIGSALFHQALALEILHQRIYRLVRDAHRVRDISDPQFSGIKYGRQHFANPVGFDRRALRLRAAGG